MNPGVQLDMLAETTVAAGTAQRDFIIQSDAVLATLSVDSVVGTLDVSVYGFVGDEEILVFSFPTISAPVDLVLKRSGPTVSNLRVKATYSAAGTTYKVQCRAINSGSSDVRILGSAGWSTDGVTVGTSPTLLIASALIDRAGFLIKNWSNTQTVYVAESMAQLLVKPYPLAPKDAVSMDVTTGAEVWAIADAAGADVRIIQAGG